jgi:NAD(P)-dependent dehydrogenase (short-subunit alcohol dehydrogenase family)
MGRLPNKVALITGTGGGQGRAAALRFAREGAIVVGCDFNAEGHEETAALMQAEGFTLYGSAPVDLGDHEQAKAWIDAAVACTTTLPPHASGWSASCRSKIGSTPCATKSTCCSIPPNMHGTTWPNSAE